MAVKKPKKSMSKKSMKKAKGGHSGGMNVCLGDGSVRFVSTSIPVADQSSELSAKQST
jgi:prepilin-type processing-associated H-X9-DG protein